MKIAIDCADLDNQRIDGTRVYIKNLLNWFGRIDKKSQFLLYHRKDFNPELKPVFYDNYIEKKIPYGFWWTQTRLAYELLQEKPDVLWMPIQQMPYLINERMNTVVTIHDLAFKIFPDYFTQSDRFKLNLFTDYAVKNADKIIAVSQSTKKDILKFYPKINPDKIKVIYHGVNKSRVINNKIPLGPPFQKGEKKSDKEESTSYKLQATSYLLYLGAIQPRKDLATLVKAFEKLKDKEEKGKKELANDFPLVQRGSKGDLNNLKLIIAGAPAWQSERILERIKNSKYFKDIILTGQVSFEEARELYKNAQIFIFPSLYEGFGMPILEAWSNKTPVIVADNSSLSEIGDQAVLKFKTGDEKELSKKIEKILKNGKIKRELINKGTERLKHFSWRKCAEETLTSLKL